MRQTIIGFTVGAIIAVAVAAWADTITIGASKDATIYGGSVNNSNGAGPGMFSGTDGNSARSRALIAFDVAGNVPANATITDAQLILALGMVAGGGGNPGPTPVTIELHKLSADWGEGATGSTSTMIGGTGSGFPANAGDATWNARNFSSSLWSTPGGDYGPSISASAAVGTTLTTTSNNTFYTWGSTPGLIADVQSWLGNSSSDFGWIMVNADETSARTFRAFYTRESATAALRPQLQITYAVPEPCGVVLAVLAVPMFLIVKRRSDFAKIEVRVPKVANSRADGTIGVVFNRANDT